MLGVLLGLFDGFVFFVGGDDLLDEGVADDVGLAKFSEGDALDVAEDFLGDGESRGLVAGKVGLGEVASDDHFRLETEAGQHHLHLGGGGVLGFVEDDEGVVEGATAHVGQGRDFDDVALHEVGHLFLVDHFIEGIVERTQVGVDLLLQIAG